MPGPVGGAAGSTGNAAGSSDEAGTTTSGTEVGDDGGSEAESTDAASGSCDEGWTCREPPPDGWFGPMVLSRAQAQQELAGCDGEYPATGTARYFGVTMPQPHGCECTCGVNVANCIATVTDAPNACVAADFPTLVEEGCTTLAITDEMIVFDTAHGPSCDRQSDVLADPAQWEAIVRDCTGAYMQEGCHDGTVCTPDPPPGFDTAVCVGVGGDVDCPPGAYTQKVLTHAQIDDSRGCSACECGTPVCDDAIEYFEEAGCAGAPAGVAEDGACLGPMSIGSVQFDFSEASCPVATAAEPVGEIVLQSPYTYCCEA